MKKTTIKLSLLLLSLAATPRFANGQAFSEGFDDIYNMTGWDMINMSNPPGLEDWVQGYSTLANQTYYFIANSGADTAFICGSFNNTSGAGVISNWLLTPAVAIGTGDSLSFWTRSTDLAGTVYPDRMQVRQSATNSTNVGTDELGTGDFTELLLDINDAYTTTDYPFVWTQYVVYPTVAAASGRFAFRYFVEDGGPSGANSFIIGIDDVAFFTTTGIADNDREVIGISAYPNPATDQVKFELAAALARNAAVNVTDAVGKIVMKGELNAGTKAQIVDISRLSAGTYMININDAEGTTYRARFTKN
jgi:hypothetical protein